MAKVLIEFDVDNDAFVVGFSAELRRVLSTAAHKVVEQRRRKPATVCTAPESADILRDVNGNSIGTVKYLR